MPFIFLRFDPDLQCFGSIPHEGHGILDGYDRGPAIAIAFCKSIYKCYDLFNRAFIRLYWFQIIIPLAILKDEAATGISRYHVYSYTVHVRTV